MSTKAETMKQSTSERPISSDISLVANSRGVASRGIDHAGHRLDEGKLAYSMRELATALGLSEKTIYNLIRAGKLRAVKFSRAVRIPRESVAQLLTMPDEHLNETTSLEL